MSSRRVHNFLTAQPKTISARQSFAVASLTTYCYVRINFSLMADKSCRHSVRNSPLRLRSCFRRRRLRIPPKSLRLVCDLLHNAQSSSSLFLPLAMFISGNIGNERLPEKKLTPGRYQRALSRLILPLLLSQNMRIYEYS